jgi:long-chain fatty acid transport protein
MAWSSGVRRLAAGAFAAIAWPNAAQGAGLASARFGGEHGSVVATNPTALYFNPAGIALGEGVHAFLDGQLALRQVTWSHRTAPSDPPDPPGGQGANAGEASAFNVFGGPALAATARLGNLAVGAGLFVPFGGIESWAKNPHFHNPAFPQASDGVQRWHIIDGTLIFLYLTAGVAYRWGRVAVGAAVNLIRSSVTTRQAKNPSGSGLPDTLREGRADLDVSGIHGSLAAGVALEAIADRLWFGASYQGQPGLGVQTLQGTLALASPAGATMFNVALTQSLPDIFRLGARWRPGSHLELRLFGDYTRWSVMQTQCVAIQGHACSVFPDGSDASGGVLANYRRAWNDTYGARVGGSYWVKPGIELTLGFGFETAAVPDSTLEPGIVDAPSVGISLGGRFAIADWFYLGASYTHLQFMNRDNTGQSALAAAQVPTQQQDGGGRYTQWIGIVDVNVERQF